MFISHLLVSPYFVIHVDLIISCYIVSYIMGVMWDVIFQDFRLVKLCFIVMTTYLLYEELNVFFVKRPTVTSFTEEQLTPTSFPEIIICSNNGFSQKWLNIHGYDDSFQYKKGVPRDKSFIGWFGHQPSTSTLDRESFLRNISHIRTVEDCPHLLANFVINGTFKGSSENQKNGDFLSKTSRNII